MKGIRITPNIRIENTGYEHIGEHPYPFFVREDLPLQLLQNIRRNWPGLGNFFVEIPGNYVCELQKFFKSGFWAGMREQIFPSIIGRSMVHFASYISARYPEDTDFLCAVTSVMQSEGDYGGHDVHTHHYHDPTWVMTILIYIDAAAPGHNGTTILRVKDGLDPAKVAARTLDWHDTTEEYATIEYKQGRVVTIMDNVIAFHSVKPSAGSFGRRILRLHICANVNHCERLYGVPYAEYQQRMAASTGEDPELVSWMQKDMDILKNPIPMTDDEKVAWVNTLKLHFQEDT